MSAGDLIERPGQREWAGVLFDVKPSGLWIGSDTDCSQGWTPTFDIRNAETAVGGAPGLPRPLPMYPRIEGLLVEDAATLGWLREAMHPSVIAAPLVWWDEDEDLILSVMACPQVCDPWKRRRAPREPRRANVAWFVEDPNPTVLDPP
jgi:hypothetical protein